MPYMVESATTSAAAFLLLPSGVLFSGLGLDFSEIGFICENSINQPVNQYINKCVYSIS